MEQVREHGPELLVSLQQQISVRAVRADVPVEQVRRALGGPGALCLLWGVAEACGVRGTAPAVPRGKLAEGVARACALGNDMGVPFGIPGEWEAPLLEELSRQECALDSPSLRALAEAALRARLFLVAEGREAPVRDRGLRGAAFPGIIIRR